MTPTVSTQDPHADSPAGSARCVLKTLIDFFPVFRDYSPLSIGIDKQLAARMPDIDRKSLRIALGMHTNSVRYLKSFEKATRRHDLDGKATDEVTDAHRRRAAEILRDRYKKERERRKKQRELEAQAKQNSDKLNQLLLKYGKKN